MRKFLLLLFPAIAFAQAPIPIRIDSRAASAPEITPYQAAEVTYRVSFTDGTNPVSLVSLEPFMSWSTNSTAATYATSTYSVVSQSGGVVDFTFSAPSMNYTPGRYLYESGLRTASGIHVYRQGVVILRGSPYASQVDPISWATSNINWSLINWTGLPTTLAGYGIVDGVDLANLLAVSGQVVIAQADIDAHEALTGTNAHGLGTAATNATADFATAAQGALAATALQVEADTNALAQLAVQTAAQANTNTAFSALHSAHTASNAVLQAQIDAAGTSTVTLIGYNAHVAAQAATNTLLDGRIVANTTGKVAQVTYDAHVLAQAGTNAAFSALHAAQANTNAGNQAAIDALRVATNAINTRVGATETATGALNTAVGNLQVATNAINIRVGTAETAISSLQTSTGALNTAVGALQVATNALNTRAGALETATGALNTVAGTLGVATNALNVRMGNAEAATGALNTAVGALNVASNALDGRVTLLEGAGYLTTGTNRFDEVTVANIKKISTNISGLTWGTYTGSVTTVSYTGATPTVQGKAYVWGFTKQNANGTGTLTLAGATMRATASGLASNYFTAVSDDTNLVLKIDGTGSAKSDISNVFVREITNGNLAVAGRLDVGGSVWVNGQQSVFDAASNGTAYVRRNAGWVDGSTVFVGTNNATYTATVALATGAYPASNPSNFISSAGAEALWIAASNTVVYTNDATYTAAVQQAGAAYPASNPSNFLTSAEVQTMERYYANTNAGESVQVLAEGSGMTATRTNSTWYFDIPAGVVLNSAVMRVAGSNTDGGKIYLNMGTNDMNNASVATGVNPMVGGCFREDTLAVRTLTAKPNQADPTLTEISGMGTGVEVYNFRLTW